MLLLKEVDSLSLLDICTNEQILHVIRSSDCAVHSCVGMGLCTKIQALKKKLCDEAFSNPEERDFRLISVSFIKIRFVFGIAGNLVSPNLLSLSAHVT